MPGPKSDRATIEMRRYRLAELLADGLTPAQATPILVAEGFPASHDTVQNDVVDLVGLVKEKKLPLIHEAQIRANARLDDLEGDLEAALLNKQIDPAERISLALAILKARRELLGLDAPRKSESKNTHLNVSVTPEMMGLYDRFFHEGAGLEPNQFEPVWELLRKIPRKPTLDATPPADSPLWHQGEQKELPE